jgi:hypothetical protein
MERTLRKVVDELLSKTVALRHEREELISRCQQNCKMCSQYDCPNRVFIKARATMQVDFVKR